MDQAHIAGETNRDSRERKGYWQLLESRLVIRGFPGGPLAKAPYFQLQGCQVQFLAGELELARGN